MENDHKNIDLSLISQFVGKFSYQVGKTEAGNNGHVPIDSLNTHSVLVNFCCETQISATKVEPQPQSDKHQCGLALVFLISI